MVEEDGGGWGGGQRRLGWRGCFGTHGVRRNGGGEEGGTMSSGRACLKCEEIYKLSPHLKSRIHRIFADGDFGRREFVLAPTVYESGRESILDGE